MPTRRGCCARGGIILASDWLAPFRLGSSGRPPGRMVSAGACAGGSRLTPGGGQVMPRARRPLGVLGAGPPAISRRESLPRRVLGAASSAVATPRVAPGPAHAGLRVAPAHRVAFKEKPPTSAWPRSFRLPRNGGRRARLLRVAERHGYSGEIFLRRLWAKNLAVDMPSEGRKSQ